MEAQPGFGCRELLGLVIVGGGAGHPWGMPVQSIGGRKDGVTTGLCSAPHRWVWVLWATAGISMDCRLQAFFWSADPRGRGREGGVGAARPPPPLFAFFGEWVLLSAGTPPPSGRRLLLGWWVAGESYILGGQGCIRREGASEAGLEAGRQAAAGGCQSGWGRSLSVYKCH